MAFRRTPIEVVVQRLEVGKQHSEEMGLQGSKLHLGGDGKKLFSSFWLLLSVSDKDNDKNFLFPTQGSC